MQEKVILNQIDWKTNGDPYFYENHHLEPKLIKETKQEGGEEYWIYYNTRKFSGKKLVIKPGRTFRSVDNGVYNILVWSGKGRYDGHEIEAGNFECDELLVSYEKATKPLIVEDTGKDDLQIIKFFGPDINKDVPYIKNVK